MTTLKFSNKTSAELFAIDEGLAKYSDLVGRSEQEVYDICENVTTTQLLERSGQKKILVDRIKSRDMEKKWVHKRKNFMKGIKRFNKSLKGRRAHENLKATRNGKGSSNIYENYTMINSLITRFAIDAGFSGALMEEAEHHVLFEEAVRILTPVLSDIMEGKVSDLNERLNQDESGFFIDDIISINEDSHSPGEVTAADVISKAPPADRLLRDPELSPYNQEQDDTDKAEIKNSLKDGKPSDSHKSGPVSSDNVTEALNLPPSSNLVDIVESFNSDEDGVELELINEAKGDPDVDGVHVIGKVVGPAFFPNSTSRNKVEYSRELWEQVLSKPETITEMSARRLYNTFGHGQKIDDEALLDGRISHITTKAYINDAGVGICECLILNTIPGRNLLTYLGAKSKLRVSTRCRGTYLTKSNAKGNAVPDPRTFQFKGVDFVHDPGYLSAEPSMSHS